MDEPSRRSKKVLQDLLSRWDRHVALYGKVIYSAAFARHNGRAGLIVAHLVPAAKGSKHPPELRVDYGTLLLVRGQLSIKDAKAVLRKLLKDGILALPGAPEVELKATLQPHSVMHHRGQHHRFSVRYPADEFRFSVERSPVPVQVPHALVCTRGLNLYPNPIAAIAHVLGISVGDANAPEIVALVPDYRGRVHRVRMSSACATVFIETPQNSAEHLLGKVYAAPFAR